MGSVVVVVGLGAVRHCSLVLLLVVDAAAADVGGEKGPWWDGTSKSTLLSFFLKHFLSFLVFVFAVFLSSSFLVRGENSSSRERDKSENYKGKEELFE